MKKLRDLVKNAQRFPRLAHIYTLEMDRQLRALKKGAITFSAISISEHCIATAKEVGLDLLFTAKEKTEVTNAIYQAELLVKEGKYSEAISHAFMYAQGPQVNGLNIFFANNSTQRPEIRLHYLNKYLSNYGLRIDLDQGDDNTFFYRLKSGQAFKKVDGPLITVIMPAYNSEATIEQAINSLLKQSWCNLQVIIVDDASTDSTLRKATDLAKRDPRVEVFSNPINVGSYVSRNLGVLHARGEWITVHDADDWAFPDRIEQQVRALKDSHAVACTGGMLRMKLNGKISRPSPTLINNEDGYQRLCFVSLMVQTEVFRNKLGAWDSVRAGGDAELIRRLDVLGCKGTHLVRPLMLCLDHPLGLTNHAELGLYDEHGDARQVRSDYRQAYERWHQMVGNKKMKPFANERLFEIPKAIQISKTDIARVISFDSENMPYKIVNELDTSNPNQILISANEIKKGGGSRRAIALTEECIPAELSNSTHILRANVAINLGNEESWLYHLNNYLVKFNITPLRLKGEGSIFNRLVCTHHASIDNGPLISVIMPAWNSEKTVFTAAVSILNQTWKNLELLIVDDCSTDGTWSILQEISAKDSRVKIMRNKVNVGPYVSKNIALIMAKGEWITGHDSDDFAFPNRLELHIKRMIDNKLIISTAAKIRMAPDGRILVGRVSNDSDGVAGQAFISCFYESRFLKQKLGAWDSVRFGADGEIINRAKEFYGESFRYFSDFISMICLDLPDGLTNNKKYGINENGLSQPRKIYLTNYKKWHKNISIDNVQLAFPMNKRSFDCDELAIVPIVNVIDNLNCVLSDKKL